MYNEQFIISFDGVLQEFTLVAHPTLLWSRGINLDLNFDKTQFTYSYSLCRLPHLRVLLTIL